MEDLKNRVKERLDELVAMSMPLQTIKRMLNDEFQNEFKIVNTFLAVGNTPWYDTIEKIRKDETCGVYIVVEIEIPYVYKGKSMYRGCGFSVVYNTHPLFNYPNKEVQCDSEAEESDEE